jgi:hypothetical protein
MGYTSAWQLLSTSSLALRGLRAYVLRLNSDSEVLVAWFGFLAWSSFC